ncbi:all trans-polyprenyl-diphosphate synthase PDSS2-like [Pararge aegeria]|uniref:Jg23041 protein n=1 Tax=Pararge aegeria aegeria TaxID=348720 RepID=A0A8S4S0B0_9NEOP|nr:all trans-polyprenyl-diphosphate synthase PDSS2-like [Pararge aegeria]CAH2244830.1 jg23041 [Pararge aegeria aegeria]
MSYAMIRHFRRTTLLCEQMRVESTLTNVTQEEFLFRPPVPQWSKVIREAEKIVGYPTSFMNLRWLLSDEFANLAMHLRKIVGSNHPIMKTAKTVLYNEHNNLQPWGLIILLLSKAVSSSTYSVENTTLMERQRMLAELTEMIRTGHYIHKGLLNIPLEERDKTKETSIFANKIAVLIGDYLLVTANGMLARLRNQDLSYLISTALRDLSEGEFFGPRDKQNMPLPGKPVKTNEDYFKINGDTIPLDVKDTLGSPVKEWTLRTMYNGGSLFGRGCEGAMLLGGKSDSDQKKAYLFGCHLCLAWQAASELQKFTSTNKEAFSLVSAPALFALNSSPDMYESLKSVTNVSSLDFDDLKKRIMETDAMEQTKSLFSLHAEKAKSYIEMFGDNQSVSTIKSLIKTV